LVKEQNYQTSGIYRPWGWLEAYAAMFPLNNGAAWEGICSNIPVTGVVALMGI
jgi:hypothetical protein